MRLLVALLLLVVLGSCTLEHRVYRDGYYLHLTRNTDAQYQEKSNDTASMPTIPGIHQKQVNPVTEITMPRAAVVNDKVLPMKSAQTPADSSHKRLPRKVQDKNIRYPKKILLYSGAAFLVGQFGTFGMFELLSVMTDFSLGLVFLLALLILSATLFFVIRSRREKHAYDTVTGTTHHGWRDLLMAVFNTVGILFASFAMIFAFWLLAGGL